MASGAFQQNATTLTGVPKPRRRFSQWGDPEVRKDPKRWTGAPVAPAKMSQCPPDYLDAVAEFKAWQASKEAEKGDEEGAKKAGYCRKDAARARGWAKRLRAGWKPPVDPTASWGEADL